MEGKMDLKAQGNCSPLDGPSSHCLPTNRNRNISEIGRGRATFRISAGRGKIATPDVVPSKYDEMINQNPRRQEEEASISLKYQNVEEDTSPGTEGYSASGSGNNSDELFRRAGLSPPGQRSQSAESIMSGVAVGSIAVSRGRGMLRNKPPALVMDGEVRSVGMRRNVNSKQLRRPNSQPPSSGMIKEVIKKPIHRPNSLPPSNPSKKQFYCHSCRRKMEHVAPELTCQFCDSAFLEEVSPQDDETILQESLEACQLSNVQHIPVQIRCHSCKENFKTISKLNMNCPFCQSDFVEEVSYGSDTFQSDEEHEVHQPELTTSGISIVQYFCHQCNKPVVVTSSYVLQCPLCKSGAIEKSWGHCDLPTADQSWNAGYKKALLATKVENTEERCSNGADGWTDWNDVQMDAQVSYKSTEMPTDKKVNFIERQKMLMQQCKGDDFSQSPIFPAKNWTKFVSVEKITLEKVSPKIDENTKSNYIPYSKKSLKKSYPLLKRSFTQSSDRVLSEEVSQNEEEKNQLTVKDIKPLTKCQLKRAKVKAKKDGMKKTTRKKEGESENGKESEESLQRKETYKAVQEVESYEDQQAKEQQAKEDLDKFHRKLKDATQIEGHHNKMNKISNLTCMEEYQSAIDILRNALKVNGENVVDRLQLAELFLHLENYGEALKDSLAARELEPSNDQVNRIVVMSGIMVGDVTAARTSLARIAQVDLENPNWEDEIQAVEETTKNAKACHGVGNHVGAVRHAKAGLAYARHHVELYLILVKSLMMMGRLTESLRIATRLLEILGQHDEDEVQERLEVLFMRGVIFTRLEQTDKAIGQFKALLLEDSSYPYAKSKLDSLVGALAHNRECNQLCGQAEALMQSGDVESALHCLDQTMDLPTCSRDTAARVLHLRGQILEQLARFAEAEEALGDILDLEMKGGEWRLGPEMKGNVLAERGRYLAARGEVEAAMEYWEEAGRYLGGVQVIQLLIWANNNLIGIVK